MGEKTRLFGDSGTEKRGRGDVTAIDRFGNTPLADSLRATKAQYREVAQLLSTLGKSHGRAEIFMSDAFKVLIL